jgi:hypothetical protein
MPWRRQRPGAVNARLPSEPMTSSDRVFRRTAVRVLLVETLVLIALWLAGRWFSA